MNLEFTIYWQAIIQFLLGWLLIVICTVGLVKRLKPKWYPKTFHFLVVFLLTAVLGTVGGYFAAKSYSAAQNKVVDLMSSQISTDDRLLDDYLEDQPVRAQAKTREQLDAEIANQKAKSAALAKEIENQ